MLKAFQRFHFFFFCRLEWKVCFCMNYNLDHNIVSIFLYSRYLNQDANDTFLLYLVNFLKCCRMFVVLLANVHHMYLRMATSQTARRQPVSSPCIAHISCED